ncbi:MAG: PAS domain S-box protein [Deltaproteobacteria bacterium]|nr:PAS domain S-box protein [Deltaproteobacteria bacterium]
MRSHRPTASSQSRVELDVRPSLRGAESAIVVCDAHGVVEWASAGVPSLCGRTPTDLIGRCAKALAHEAGVDIATVESVRTRLAAGETVRLELRFGLPLAKEIELCVQPVPGRFGGDCDFVAVLTDVTSREASARALAESEDRYRSLVESSPAPIVVHSDGRLRFVNPAALDLLGATTAQDLVGRAVMDFVHPDFRAVATERVRKMEETGEAVYLLEEKLLRLDGSVIDVEVAGTAIAYEGEPAIQLVGRDVTERNRSEAERRTLESRLHSARHHESLVGVAEGIAHQLAGLASAIVGTADEALSVAVEARTERALRAVRSAGLRIAALEDQLRGFAGRGRVVSRRIDLSQLVVDVSERIEAELGRQAGVSYELPGDLPRVSVDAALVRRVVLDLVRNAADALGAGPGSVRVTTRAVDAGAELLASVEPPGLLEPGRYVALEVRDTGCGMDPETRSRMLDPFFSTKSPGRGLGLSEVIGLVRAQGGGLQVQSEVGAGTIVTVLLPALPELASAGPRPRAHDHASGQS